MALYGGLAEHKRRNERVARGTLVIPVGNNGTATIGFTSSQTLNITPNYGDSAGMRVMTSFLLTVDDLGVAADGVTVTKPAYVTGSINSLGTILTVNLYVATSTSNPTLLQTGVGGSVRFAIWGGLHLATVVADLVDP